MVLVGQGLPLGVRLESASPSEVTLAVNHAARGPCPATERPPTAKTEARDCGPRLRLLSAAPMTAPPRLRVIVSYRENNQHRRYQDGRKLRPDNCRWIVERTTRLGQFRWLLVPSMFTQHLTALSSTCLLLRLRSGGFLKQALVTKVTC
jgi:hypothetical protein